ncbi:hypothetical protein N5D66_28090 [Delftia tsuruhatensis]|uniref:hypothetical protein n=1 Tax=Delftia tsuruhatensis TaxID=180282 RepID=UPI002449302F|nr:hypothetical protein [Delftia tsuruhatensis]MDH0851826.1 hypothetical protein [Delftia tsuruhatensis]
MQDKHTPGPWEAMGTWVRSPMHQPEGLPRGVQIAECRDGYFLPHTPEAKANARLIAAAPELLEALAETLAFCEANTFGGDDTAALIAKARAAVTKATGSAL